MCNDCPELNENPNEGCLSPSITSCIVYDGNDIDCAEIASGQTLNQVIEQLSNNDCGLDDKITDINLEINNIKGDILDLSGEVVILQNSISEIPNFTCEALSGCSLDSIGDVIADHVSGDVLMSNGTKWTNVNLPSIVPYQFSCEDLSGCSLDSLNSVEFTELISGDVVIFNGENFINFPMNVILNNLQNVISSQQDQLNYLFSHLFDCCGEAPTLNTDFAAATISIFCVEGNQNRLSYTFNANPVAGITLLTVKEIAVIVPSATPSIVTKNHPLSLVLTTQMREILDAAVLPENKFRIKIQYTQSATTKTAYLFFNIPYLDYDANVDKCVEAMFLPMTLSEFQDLTPTL